MSDPDVSIMTAEECGCYFFLLQAAWLGNQDCTLPNEPERLAKIGRVERVSDLVLNKFKEDGQGRLYNPRLIELWDEAQNRSLNAKNAINTRWDKKDADTGVLPPKYGSGTTKTKTKTKKKNLSVAPHTDSNLATDVASSTASPEPSTPAPSEAGRRVGAKLAQILGRDTLTPGKQTEWAEQADKLVSAHGEQKVIDVMTYHLVESADGFWRGRILAMKHLVKSFVTMQKQMGRTAGTRTAVDPLAARAASLQTGHDFSAMAKGDL